MPSSAPRLARRLGTGQRSPVASRKPRRNSRRPVRVLGLLSRGERHAGRWTFKGPSVHLVYGWLQVGAYHHLGSDGSHLLAACPWLADHPHVRQGWGEANAIFIAADMMAAPGLSDSLPGWGVLERGHQLSMPGRNPSVWRTPDWLNPARGGVGMTYHPEGRWSTNGTVQCIGGGQEFVAHVGDNACVGEWLKEMTEATR